MGKKSLTDKRMMTVIAIMIFLLLISLLPYFFFYVPSNEARWKQYGFLKLNRARTNMMQKDSDLRNYYASQGGLETLFLPDKSLLLHGKENRISGNDSLRRVQLCFYPNDGNGWSLVYTKSRFDQTTSKDQRIIGDNLAMDSFVNPCLAPARELFESFLLIRDDQEGASLLYQDVQNGVEQKLSIDSLIPRVNGLRSPDILDVTLRGVHYKMFTCPFSLNTHQMILCGFLKSSAYESRLHQMPVAIVYSLIIIFLLFIISLPLFKVFMMNEYERIFKRDLVHIGLFIFGGCTFITIVMIQVLLLLAGTKRVQDNLYGISAQISDSLATELNQANGQLQFFDSAYRALLSDSNRAHHTQDSLPENQFSGRFLKIRVADFALQKKFNPKPEGFIPYDSFSAYHYFDRVSWVDRSGLQAAKLEYAPAGFLKVGDRKYFNFFVHRSNMMSPQAMDSLLMMDPIYSWANKQFRINLVRKSQVPGIFIVTMATRLHSLVNTVLPPGYGFCIIDEKGDVAVHSDSLKSLRENFLDETENQDWIRQAISSRQVDSSSGVFFYGKSNTLRISPLHQLPLYLVTFYDESYLAPFNIRILLFSLFAWLVSSLIFLLIWIVWQPFRKRRGKSFVFNSLDYMNRIVPRKEWGHIYRSGTIFISSYLALFLFLMFAHVLSDLLVLLMILAHPFLLVIVLAFIIQRPAPKKQPENYFLWFVSLLTAASLFLAVLPPAVYTWFAHNQEFIQAVKKNQLSLATRLQKREKYIKSFLARNNHISRDYLNEIQYTRGIYTIYHDSVICTAHCESRELAGNAGSRDGRAESLYLRVINGMGFNYDDPALSPALMNSSSDGLWRWQRADSLVYFDYGRPEWVLPTQRENSGPVSIQIRSRIPKRFVFLAPGKNLVFSLIIITLLVYGFYRLLKVLVFRIFFVRIVQSGLDLQPAHSNLQEKGILQTCLDKMKDPEPIKQLLGLEASPAQPGAEDAARPENSAAQSPVRNDQPGKSLASRLNEEYHFWDGGGQPRDLGQMEIELTNRTEILRPWFDCIWKDCDDHEKFLLFDLAEDGLMNYKSEMTIYKLLRKELLYIHPKEERVKLMSYSFRLYILSKKGTDAEKELLSRTQTLSPWASARHAFMVIIIATVVFLFLTQQDVSTKITALITALTGLLPLLFRIGISGAGDSKK